MSNYRLLSHLKDVIRDTKNKIFPDRVYTSLIWQCTGTLSEPETYTATQFGSSNVWRYEDQLTDDEMLWDVTVTSTHAGAEFVYDEAASIITDEASAASGDLTITGNPINFKELHYRALMQIASDPAAAGTYCQVNGLTIDMRGASRLIRETAQQIIGVRGG